MQRIKQKNGLPDIKEDILLYEPPKAGDPANKIASVYWMPEDDTFRDDLGHKYRFVRQREYLKLHLQKEDGSIEKTPHATCILQWFPKSRQTSKVLPKNAGLENKEVRAAHVSKTKKPPEDGVLETDSSGRWVLPAYIAYIKSRDARAITQVPVKELKDYYLQLGFKPKGTNKVTMKLK